MLENNETIKVVGNAPKTQQNGAGKPRVSVIVPTYNEAKNLPLVLPYIPMDVVDEVILVDGRSEDHTINIAQQIMPRIRVVKEMLPGKGAAMRRGYREATGDILVVLDADGSNDPREIPRFVNALMEGADFVKGSRFASMGGTTDMPRLRKLGNWGFVVMTNLLFSKRFTDLAYGFHAFWRHCLDYIDVENVNGFEIDTSIYLQAMRKKLKVVEVPSFEGFRFYGEGKLKTFPDGWRVLRTITREWWKSVREPAPEPQVGFRSYGINPATPNPRTMPVTGEVVEELAGNGHIYGLRNGQSLNELFEDRMQTTALEDMDIVLPQVLVTGMEIMGASSASLILLDRNKHVMHGYRIFGRNLQDVQVEDVAETLENGILGWVIENRQPCIIENTKNDDRWHRRAWEEEEDTARSAVVFPLFLDNQVRGVLTVTRPADRPYDATDLYRLMGNKAWA